MTELNWSATSEEELQKILGSINEELNRRKKVELEEAKAKTVIAIRELIEVCRKHYVLFLGDVEWECSKCVEIEEFDILNDKVLQDVVEVLEK